MYAVAHGLTYTQSRVLEQAIITAYTLNNLQNLRNSIAQKNWNQFEDKFEDMQTLIQSYWDPE
ncbi:MAG: hypothetical protein K6G88_10550 [Lachnospiraceae bacterium]|nr:hypothetical protein [Lachnospiraceae bacterium]